MIPTARHGGNLYVPAALYVRVWAAVIVFDVLVFASLLALGVVDAWWPETTNLYPWLQTWGLAGFIPAFAVTVASGAVSSFIYPDTAPKYPGAEPLVPTGEPIFVRRGTGWDRAR